MQVFRTYLQSIKKNKIVLQNISQGHSSRINGREPQSHPGASTVPMSGRQLLTLELLAFD